MARDAFTPVNIAPLVSRIFPTITGQWSAEDADWIHERRAFRRALDGLSDLEKWFDSKPTLTDIEFAVMDREDKSRKRFQVVNASKVSMQDKDEDVVANLQKFQKGVKTEDTYSTSGGNTGNAVNSCRKQRFTEYLCCLELCQQQGLPVTPATLQRALLHPEDVVCVLEASVEASTFKSSPSLQRTAQRQHFAKKKTSKIKIRKNQCYFSTNQCEKQNCQANTMRHRSECVAPIPPVELIPNLN